MSDEIVPFDAAVLRAMSACMEHARDLLASARLIQDSGKPNIAFHLAILALEELGRRELLGIKAIEPSRTYADKHLQDHVQKLFWCFFSARFAEERITREALDTMKGLATRLHNQRLASLYVDLDSGGTSVPSEQISKDDAERIVSLGEARLGLAESYSLRDGRTKEELEMQAWFLRATEEPERRKFIFTGTSLDKLAALGAAGAWMNWLKEEFEKADAESRALAEAELERGRQLMAEGRSSSATKWKVRIRLYTNSHSVRQKALNHWNDRAHWIKLHSVQGKKDQLILELLLGEQVPVQALWLLAWGVARSFVAALNIATMGFWFWRVPTQVTRYYESIEDVTNRSRLTLDRQPSLAPDWGGNGRALTEREMDDTISTFVCLPRPADGDRLGPYNHYMGGLTFLSLNDVHWQCEATILGNFFSSHRAMMQEMGDVTDGKAFSVALEEFVRGTFTKLDEDFDRLLALSRTFEQDQLHTEQVTLKEATFGKLFCDAYFLGRIRPREIARRRDAKAG